jgi:hypothetical protein
VPASPFSIAIDLIQWMVFCSRKWPRAACATSSAVHGSVGLAPTLRKSDPCAERACPAAASQRSVHCRYSERGMVSSYVR